MESRNYLWPEQGEEPSSCVEVTHPAMNAEKHLGNSPLTAAAASSGLINTTKKGEWEQRLPPAGYPTTAGPKTMDPRHLPPGWTKAQQFPATLTPTGANTNDKNPADAVADESMTRTFGSSAIHVNVDSGEGGRLKKDACKDEEPLEAVEEGRQTTRPMQGSSTETTPTAPLNNEEIIMDGLTSEQEPTQAQQQQQQHHGSSAPSAAVGAKSISEPQVNDADPEQAQEQQHQKPQPQQEEQAPQEHAPTTTASEEEEEEQQHQSTLFAANDDLVQATLICDVDDTNSDSNVTGPDNTMSPLPQTILLGDTTSGAIAVESDIAVVEAKPVLSVQAKTMSRRLICLVMGMLVLVIAALSVGFVVSAQRRGGGNDDSDSSPTTTTKNDDGNGDENSSTDGQQQQQPMVGGSSMGSLSPTATPIPVLQRLREEGGNLRCGVIPGPGLFYHNDDGEPLGFDAALCAAVAAAATGDPKRVEYHHELYQDVFKALKEGQVDLLSGGITHTMSRQVRETSTKTGFAFTSPYLYQGMQLAGTPTLVDCGDQGLEYIAACAAIRVCVVNASTHQLMLSSYLPGQKLIPIDNRDNLRKSLQDGTCNVIAHEGYNLAESLVRAAGYEGPYKVGRTLFSKEPLAMITASDDPEFSDFVNSVLQGLVVAEANNITQSTANEFQQTDAFGDEYLDMFRHALAAGGNYGELYEEFLEPYSKRQGLNLINYGDSTDTGLLYSHPFGSLTSEGGGQARGSILDIRRRGVLRCGVRSNRIGFAELEFNNATGQLISFSARGMEIDYCRALAGSIFEAQGDQVEFIEVLDQQDGFAKLHAGDLDVLAGATWSFITEVRVPEIDQGFTFTQPYFYGSKGSLVEEDNLCLATRHDDHLWSSFVYWISAAIVQAEEIKIDQGMSNNMPPIYLFGEELSLCFQDAILTVGNQKEIYDRNLQDLIPRSGRNLPNGNRGPELYPIPGLME